MRIGPVCLGSFVDELQQYQTATFCLVGVDHRRDRIQHHVKPPIHPWSELNWRAGAGDEEAAVQIRRQADQVTFVAADSVEEQPAGRRGRARGPWRVREVEEGER